MTYKAFLIACAICVSGCVAADSNPDDARVVRIMVEAHGKNSFEKLVASAQPLADQACASEGKRAKWAVATSVSDTHTRLSFTCY